MCRLVLTFLDFPQVPVCGVCIAGGEKHHKHSVIAIKDAAGSAKAAVEGYAKAAQTFAKEAEGHSKALISKLQGPALSLFICCVDACRERF
jgi:hypothetical protein